MAGASNDLNGWQPCPKGELVRFVESVKARRRQAVAVRVTSVALAAVLLIAVGLWAARRGRGSAVPRASSPLTCRQVEPNLRRYVSGGLDDSLRQRIEQHLQRCPECRKRLQELRQALGRELTDPSDSHADRRTRSADVVLASL